MRISDWSSDVCSSDLVDLTATFASGDSFGGVLQRAGVGSGDARRAADLIAQAIDLGDPKPATRLALTLGRRPDQSVPRPLEKLAFRAPFHLITEEHPSELQSLMPRA